VYMKSYHRYFFSALSVLLAFMLSGFGLPGVKIPTPDLVPKKLTGLMIDKLAGKIYDSKIKKAKEANQLDTDDALMAQITEVFEKLKKTAEQSKSYNKRAKKIQWELHLIDSREENAFAWPGGKIILYKGILPFAGDEAGLATLLGHEMIHVLDRHADARINDNVNRVGGISILFANPSFKKLDTKIMNAVLVGLGVGSVGADAAFSRDNELEADHNGLLLAAEAGYEPKKALIYWTRLIRKKKRQAGITYLKTHPSNKKRLDVLRQKKSRFQKAYDNAKEKHPSRPLVHVDSE